MKNRRLTFFLCAPGMLAMLAVPWLSSFAALIACFSVAMIGYAACATIYLALPSVLALAFVLLTSWYPARALPLAGTGVSRVSAVAPAAAPAIALSPAPHLTVSGEIVGRRLSDLGHADRAAAQGHAGVRHDAPALYRRAFFRR